jgi:hypothetical protein
MMNTKLAAAALAAALLPVTTVIPAAALDVLSHSPAPYALGVAAATSITVTFDTPLNPVTVTGNSVIVRGLMSGIHPANLSVNGAVLTIDPQADFMVGEIATINLTSGIQAMGGAVLTGGHTFQFTVRVDGGGLEFQELGQWSTLPGQTPYFVFGGDLNNDGSPDAAVPNEDSNNLSVFLNNGGGNLSQHSEFTTGSVPSSCYGDDFDRDGDLDVATANISSANMTVLLNNGSGTSFASTNYPGGITCRQVYGGDFDGDGDTDLVTTGFSDNTINLHFNQGNGTFAPRVIIPSSPGPFPVFVGDMNLDGHPDLVVGFQGTPRQVQIFLNQGGGTFAAGPTLAVGGGAWDFFGNDLDGDGDLDLALVEAQTSRVRVIYGDGAGGFASTTTFLTGSFPLAVFTADLDGDHDHEIMSSDFSGRDVRVFENAGAGQFPLAETLPTIQSGSYAWGHDMDGDGDLDLTVVDELADRIFVFRNLADPATIPGGEDSPPRTLRLLEPYPNPASKLATIPYEAPPGAQRITLRLYDVSGRLVRTLIDGPPAPGGRGTTPWDVRTAGGARVPAGVYLVYLDGGAAGTAATRLHVIR